MTQRWIYSFALGEADGSAELKPLLGGKGAGLAEMTRLGLPVPPGFTITTGACTWFFAHDEACPTNSTAPSMPWRQRPARSSAMIGIHSWCRSAPVPRCRCPA